jgi:hypothetical protein
MLDEFAKGAGLVIGEVYSLDLFNAERHPAGSNFKNHHVDDFRGLRYQSRGPLTRSRTGIAAARTTSARSGVPVPTSFR